MKIIDNITETVRDDMEKTIEKGSRVSIAAACFSMYAYKELKKQLESVEELRFIFTSPTFVTERAEKAKREFYIPRFTREHSLYGTEFEIKLRNELSQKAIVRERADWIRCKARFKSNSTGENMGGFATVDSSSEAGETLKGSVQRDDEIQALKKQIEKLQAKVRKEKQLNVQMKLNAELKALKKELEAL